MADQLERAVIEEPSPLSQTGASKATQLPLGGTEPIAAAEAPKAEDTLAPVLEAWHTELTLRGDKGPLVRFVACFNDRAPPDSELTAAASRQLGLPVAAGPLFAPDPELDRFRLLRVEGVARPDRTDLFEVAAALRTALGATVVEPDLGTDYYCDERPPPDRAGPESADIAFWCWADPDRDKPADANWALAKTRIREAWACAEAANRAVEGEGILIFQPDTGVVSAHAELPPWYCQLKRPWYARRVGGAAARVGELLYSPIMLPRSSRAGPEKGALDPLS
jgi:hypothetical protein